MPIKRTTPMLAIESYTATRLEALQRATLRTLAYCGEMCITAARSQGSYKDRTGNLRSSTGYVIAMDGRVVRASDFTTVRSGGKGAQSGRQTAIRLARQYPKGICLIVVAGMDYAVHVQNRGYDVLDSAELTADRIVPQMLRDLGLK